MADLALAPVIVILRGVTPETTLSVCKAIAAGGVRFIEVTLNSPKPLESIARAAKEFSGSGVHIGAGTVLSPEEVDAVAEAGGRYIISPNSDPSVIRRTRERGLISIPGFLTPTEAFMSVAAGADLLKCFPVGRMGPGYIKDLKAVLPVPVLAVGGVSASNAREFLASGACGVGVGSCVYRANRTSEEISEGATALIQACREEGQ
ncbi:MAG: 2-dehydro-3-deoxy-6-phosphogalactonate aldolase [Lentisphaerae bacterium]|nr:2-dehydro-3-deoxy-6-phosphogalactonate aldolase [Lentisphaerota bacterium]